MMLLNLCYPGMSLTLLPYMASTLVTYNMTYLSFHMRQIIFTGNSDYLIFKLYSLGEDLFPK